MFCLFFCSFRFCFLFFVLIFIFILFMFFFFSILLIPKEININVRSVNCRCNDCYEYQWCTWNDTCSNTTNIDRNKYIVGFCARHNSTANTIASRHCDSVGNDLDGRQSARSIDTG